MDNPLVAHRFSETEGSTFLAHSIVPTLSDFQKVILYQLAVIPKMTIEQIADYISQLKATTVVSMGTRPAKMLAARVIKSLDEKGLIFSAFDLPVLSDKAPDVLTRRYSVSTLGKAVANAARATPSAVSPRSAGSPASGLDALR